MESDVRITLAIAGLVIAFCVGWIILAHQAKRQDRLRRVNRALMYFVRQAKGLLI